MSFFELQRNYFVAFMVDESILMAIFRLLALLSHHGSVRDVNAHTREAIAQRRRPVILQWDDDPSRLVNEPPLSTDTYFRAAFGKLKRVIELRLNHELKIFVDESPLAVCPRIDIRPSEKYVPSTPIPEKISFPLRSIHPGLFSFLFQIKTAAMPS